jgi:hypothetical protein
MDDSLHDRMKRCDDLSERLSTLTRERDAVARSVETDLADVLADAVADHGANVEAVERSRDGHGFRFEARLDRAALVAAVTDRLPAGFVVSHVDEDGTLGVEWTGDQRTPAKREHGAILKAIVAEETATDADGFIESVPTRERVLARAVELGIDEDDAADRLGRLATLDVLDVTDDGVYPDEHFARY